MSKPNGDERTRVLDLFPAMCASDYFMEQVRERGKWWLIDPHEVYDKRGYYLADFYGEEWTEIYKSLVEDETIEKTEVNAIDVMRKFLESASETGKPFMFYRDTVNKMNPNKHAGMIYSSNLCTEIKQNMSETTFDEQYVDRHGKLHTVKNVGDTVVCNLSSFNMDRANHLTEEEFEETLYLQMRMLDNVIDVNFYPIKEAEVTNKKYRAVGAGIMNYHAYMANKGIVWESEAHIAEADRFFAKWNYYIVKASYLLAQERGAYSVFEGSDYNTGDYFVIRGLCTRDEEGNLQPVEGNEHWYDLAVNIVENGVRNGWMEAIAPTASISVISGTTAGTDPIFSKFFFEEKKYGMIPQVAPNLNEDNFFYYKEANTINQTYSIRAQGARQKHIDQGNSFNLYVNQNTTPKEMLDFYDLAWQEGLKSVYYMRTKTLSVEECLSCQ
jgi:ribonucleoside-diphosphate reductase alpha chain